MDLSPAPRWLVDIVREFSPKVIPLDVTPDGGYEEATTRWGLNPLYEAIPADLREVVEDELFPVTRQYIQKLRAEGS